MDKRSSRNCKNTLFRGKFVDTGKCGLRSEVTLSSPLQSKRDVTDTQDNPLLSVPRASIPFGTVKVAVENWLLLYGFCKYGSQFQNPELVGIGVSTTTLLNSGFTL